MIILPYQYRSMLSGEEHPCPRCEYLGATLGKLSIESELPPAIEISCAYDCGEYVLDLYDWILYQDNYDPTGD